MKTGGKVAVAIILIALLCIVVVGFYTSWTFKLEEWQEPGPTPPAGAEWLGGTYTLTVKGKDSLDSSASLTAGTDFTAEFYAYRNNQWISLGSEDGTGTNIESDAADNGYIWLLVEEISTKYFYAAVPMTVEKNTYILSVEPYGAKWVDADTDTDSEWLYKISLWNIPPPASGYPSRTFYPYFLAESSQGTDANALQWETQPDNITGIGTSTTTKYIKWETKLTAEKRAVGAYKIEITVNTTDTTLFEIDKVNIPGVGYLDGSLFGEDVRSSDTKYQYIIGSDFRDIVYWKVPAGTNNCFDNTVAVKFTLGSGDILEFTLYIYQWLYDRTSISDNDAVCCSQA